MADKQWKDMSVDEKLEALRKDIQRLFDIANTTNATMRQERQGLAEIFNRISRLEMKV